MIDPGLDPATDAPAAPQPVDILLVAADPARLATYAEILGGPGQRLIAATSAGEALQILRETEVALILADVSMPAPDGLSFADALKEHPRFAAGAIIFIAHDAQSAIDRLQGHATGAVDYVTTPVAPELLRAKARVFVDLYRKQQELERLKRELEGRVEERTAELAAFSMRLLESEERYRALVDNANDIVATLDLEFCFTSVNPAVERLLGYAPEEVIGSPLSRFVPADQLVKHTTMLREKLAGAGSTQYEMQLLGKDRRQRHTLEVNSKLMFGADGRPSGVHAIARDVSGRKDAEARQLLLVRELQHRTKNMLAVIQSIARSTLTRSKDLDSALETFLGRLHALAHAQEFVAAGPGGGVPLRELVEGELQAFAARAIVEGEALVVGGSFAQIFALVVHELATNAVKYGSLSAPRGRVAIQWKIDRSAEEPELTFTWMERGGPPAHPPKEAGLGSQLLSSLGKAQAAFKEEGFEYTLLVPLGEATRGTE